MFKKPAWDDMSVVVSCSKPPLRDEFTAVMQGQTWSTTTLWKAMMTKSCSAATMRLKTTAAWDVNTIMTGTILYCLHQIVMLSSKWYSKNVYRDAYMQMFVLLKWISKVYPGCTVLSLLISIIHAQFFYSLNCFLRLSVTLLWRDRSISIDRYTCQICEA